MSRQPLEDALAAVDRANADDPNRLIVRGRLRPKELAHAELVSEFVLELCPEPSDALLVAARAHHIRRWEIPRSAYPEGREGYLRWRRALQDHHSECTARILRELGYEAEFIQRVSDLLHKRRLHRDPEVQALEDALCLAFLETQLRGLAARVESEKLVEVLRKTLRKMSPAAHEVAARMDLEPSDRRLLERASAASGAERSE